MENQNENEIDKKLDQDLKKEERKEEKLWLRYLITFGIAVAIAFGVCSAEGLFGGYLTTARVFMLLSDAFFVSGVIMFGFGLLTFVSSKGSFDGVTYSLQFVMQQLFFKRKIEGYYEYKQMKNEKRKNTPFGHMLIVGGVFLLLAGVFTALFYNVSV